MQNVVTIFQRCAFMALWLNNDANYCKIAITLKTPSWAGRVNEPANNSFG